LNFCTQRHFPYVFSPCNTAQIILAHLGATYHSTKWFCVPTNTKKVVGCRQWHFHPYRKLHQYKLRARASFAISSCNMASTVISKKLRLASGQKKDASLILDCFRGVTALKPYWNKWIVSDVWINIINSRYDISDDLKFSSKELNTAVSRNKQYKSNLIETTAIANPMGLYKAWFKTRKEDNKQTTIVAYYATSPNNLPTAPGRNSKWYYDMLSLLPRNARSTRSTVEKHRDKRCLGRRIDAYHNGTVPEEEKTRRNHL
jgi:hypothetical protein